MLTVNTLGREVTRDFFKNGASGYAALERRWSGLVSDPETRRGLRAEHHLLYAILRGKDWRKGFCIRTPDGAWKPNLTNPVKLENGGLCDWGLAHALRGLHSTLWESRLLVPFEGLITVETLQAVRALVPWTAQTTFVERAYDETQLKEAGHAA
jgi:hypothetical protein